MCRIPYLKCMKTNFKQLIIIIISSSPMDICLPQFVLHILIQTFSRRSVPAALCTFLRLSNKIMTVVKSKLYFLIRDIYGNF